MSTSLVAATLKGEEQDLSSLPDAKAYFSGSNGLPILGQTLKFLQNPPKFVSESVAKYGPIFKSSILLGKYITITDPEVASYILRNENNLVRVEWPPSTVRLQGVGAVTVVHGEAHANLRQLLTGAFQPQMLEVLSPVINEVVVKHVNRWTALGDVPDVCQVFRELTLETTIKVVLGQKGISEAESAKLLQDLIGFMKGLFSLPINVPGTAFYKGMKGRENIIKFVEKRIEDMREQLREAERGAVEDEYPSILEKLISIVDENAEVDFSYENVRDNTVVLLFAGMDTTSSTLASLFVVFSYCPDVVQKLVDEQTKIREEFGDNLSPDVLSKMRYLNATIHEFFQVFPVIGGTFRRAIKDFAIPGYNVKISKGQKIGINFHGQHFHHSPSDGLFDFATRLKKLFNPDRAFQEIEENVETGKSWAAFGQGKRRCIGEPLAYLVVRTAVSQILRTCSFEVSNSPEPPAYSWFPVPRPTKQVAFKFTKLT